jgi:hypothetical protein
MLIKHFLNMKYYYLDGIEKKGPYSLAELRSRNLSSDTMVYREGRQNWSRLSDFEDINSKIELAPNKIKKEIKNDNIKYDWNKKNNKKLFSSIIVIFLIIISYFVYQRFALSEETARETSNRFFNMLMMKNSNEDEIKKLYPDFDLIGYRIKFNNICTINNISRNSDGDYEVYASYEPNKMNNYPIYLVISRESNKTFIKSSKGINYAYYDKVLEYGKKKGCLTGNEDDITMGNIIREKKLRSDLEYETDMTMRTLYSNLKKSDDIKMEWGSISGNVTITNNNNVDFGYFDLECTVEFYNRSGQITSSEKVYGINEIKAHSSASGRVFSTSQNSTTYKIIPTIMQTDDLKNKIRENIIAVTQYGCN